METKPDSYDVVLAKGAVAIFFVFVIGLVFITRIWPWMQASEPMTVTLNLDETSVVKFESDDNSTEVSVMAHPWTFDLPFAGEYPLSRVKRIGLLKESYSISRMGLEYRVLKNETKENIGSVFSAPRTLSSDFFDVRWTEALKPSLVSTTENCLASFTVTDFPQSDSNVYLNIKGVTNFIPEVMTDNTRTDVSYKMRISTSDNDQGYHIYSSLDPGTLISFNGCKYSDNNNDANRPDSALMILALSESTREPSTNTNTKTYNFPDGGVVFWLHMKKGESVSASTFANDDSITIRNTGHLTTTLIKPKGTIHVGDKQIALDGQAMVQLEKSEGESEFKITDLTSGKGKMKMDFVYHMGINAPIGNTSKFDSIIINDNEILQSRWDRTSSSKQAFVIGSTVAIVGLIGNVIFSAASVFVLRIYRRRNFSAMPERINKLYKSALNLRKKGSDK